MGFEVPFNKTNECYTHDNIVNDNIIKLQNGEGEEIEEMKYSNYINNSKYFDKTIYSFQTSAIDSNEAYEKCKKKTEDLNSDFFWLVTFLMLIDNSIIIVIYQKIVKNVILIHLKNLLVHLNKFLIKCLELVKIYFKEQVILVV